MSHYKCFSGSVEDWFSSTAIKAKKGRSGGGVSFSAPNSRIATKIPAKAAFAAIANKSPEVLVKITGTRNGQQGIAAHMNYIGRNGNVELENEQGERTSNKDDIYDMAGSWGAMGLPYQDGKYRESFNIVLSMPEGTNPKALLEATRQFAKQEFAGHAYVMAQHLDEKHPHVHLCVMARDMAGHRLNPRKGDCFNWRVEFAAKLREQGIDATATRRVQRFQTKKPENFKVRQMKDEFKGEFKRGRRFRERAEPLVIQSQAAQFKEAMINKQRPINPAHDKLQATREQTIKSYKAYQQETGSHVNSDLSMLIEKGSRQYASKAQDVFDQMLKSGLLEHGVIDRLRNSTQKDQHKPNHR